MGHPSRDMSALVTPSPLSDDPLDPQCPPKTCVFELRLDQSAHVGSSVTTREEHSCLRVSWFATREGHDRVSIQPFAGVPSQICEAAGLLFFGGMDEHYASIRRATEINLAPRHYAQEVAYWFGDRNLPLGCNRRRHCRTIVRNDFLKVLLRGPVLRRIGQRAVRQNLECEGR